LRQGTVYQACYHQRNNLFHNGRENKQKKKKKQQKQMKVWGSYNCIASVFFLFNKNKIQGLFYFYFVTRNKENPCPLQK